MYYAGMHWPENAGGEHPSREFIVNLPGVREGIVLICSPSARYHYDFLRSITPRVIWRAIPRQGKLPAQLGWDPNKVADECLNLWDEQPHGGNEWFCPLNELQFDKENGGPWLGYAEMAQNLGRLRLQLRRKFTQQYSQSTVRLVFPAWVPSEDGDHLDEWRGEALLWDVINLHAYGSAEAIRERYASYREAFPHTPLMIGEWNDNHQGYDDWYTLLMLGEIQRTDPLFFGATRYIWETSNAGESDLSVWRSPSAMVAFIHPPQIVGPSPAPTPPLLEETVMPEFQFGFKAKADELGPDVVGEPLEPEQYIGDDVAYQFTTTGVMLYSKHANTVHFLAGSK